MTDTLIESVDVERIYGVVSAVGIGNLVVDVTRPAGGTYTAKVDLPDGRVVEDIGILGLGPETPTSTILETAARAALAEAELEDAGPQ